MECSYCPLGKDIDCTRCHDSDYEYTEHGAEWYCLITGETFVPRKGGKKQGKEKYILPVVSTEFKRVSESELKHYEEMASKNMHKFDEWIKKNECKEGKK